MDECVLALLVRICGFLRQMLPDEEEGEKRRALCLQSHLPAAPYDPVSVSVFFLSTYK